MKRISEEEKVSLLLSQKDINIVIDNTLAMDDRLISALTVSEVCGKKRKVNFTLHDLEDFSGHIAAAANHCEDKVFQNNLDSIIVKIEKTQSKYELVY
jgi:uncharacterized protein YciW